MLEITYQNIGMIGLDFYMTGNGNTFIAENRQAYILTILHFQMFGKYVTMMVQKSVGNQMIRKIV